MYRAIDREKSDDEKDDERRRLVKARQSEEQKIAGERQYRSDVRMGKAKGGVRSYIGSKIREGQASQRHRNIDDKLHPEMKKLREVDRKVKGIERRQKVRKIVRKVDDFMDGIREARDELGKEFDMGGSGDMDFFGNMAGGSKKGKKNGGGMDIDLGLGDLAQMGSMDNSFNAFSGGGGKKKGSKKKPRSAEASFFGLD